MGKQGTIRGIGCVLVLLSLAGCSALGKGSSIVDNPIVVGSVSIAAQDQCAAYAAKHPEDAAVLRSYLGTLSSAANACVAGLDTATSSD